MMRSRIALVAIAAVLGTSSVALAQAEEEGDCPPGGWFCEEPEDEPAADEDAEAQGPDAAGSADSPEPESRRAKKTPSSVVVYTPEGEPPPKVVVVQPSTAEPPPPKKRKRRRFGVNLRLQGALMGDSRDKDSDAGMGGAGISFRYRPVPHFALDFGLDRLGGTDWSGNHREEGALLINAMVFFNPRSPVQVYMLGGFGFSGADVQIEDESGDTIRRGYSYFGGQLGGGLEFRVSPLVSLNLDLVGFVRGRTDDRARYEPEFTDPETGRTTNSSGGGLLRGGITFYW
jgi:opacity protein-like surface antigen